MQVDTGTSKQMGRIQDGNFVARQVVFRTQAEFWRAGWHDWQVNAKACKQPVVPQADWDTHWTMSAETRHVFPCVRV